MSAALVILAPRIGSASETFVGRHINSLATAAETLVIAREKVPDAMWIPTPKTHYIGGRRLVPHGSLRWRVARRLAAARRRSGPSDAGMHASDILACALRENPGAGIFAEYLDVWATLLIHNRVEGRTVVVRAHGYDVSQRVMSPSWVDVFKRLADVAVIAPVSTYSRTVLLGAGLPPDRVVCVPNGVDLTQFSPRSYYEGDSCRPLKVLSVGRLVEKKDPRPTLRALRSVLDQGIEATLEIVGSGPLRKKVEAEVRDLDLVGRVVLHGVLPHHAVAAQLADADVFVQHSQRSSSGDEEGMPMSVLEAMASALPVIGTAHAGITELLKGGGGELVAPRDSVAIATLLIELAGDPLRRATLGRRARETVETRYSWDREREQLRDLLGLS